MSAVAKTDSLAPLLRRAECRDLGRLTCAGRPRPGAPPRRPSVEDPPADEQGRAIARAKGHVAAADPRARPKGEPWLTTAVR